MEGEKLTQWERDEDEDEVEDEDEDEEHSLEHSPDPEDDISEESSHRLQVEAIKNIIEEKLQSENKEVESNSKSSTDTFSDNDSDVSDDSDKLDINDITLGFTLKKTFKLIPEKENLESKSEEKICRKAAYPHTGFRCSRQTGVYNDLEMDMGLQLWDRW